MSVTAFHNGDQVRHNKRPEWGIGSILKVEMLTREGKTDQRLWIRFPNIGTKTLLASAADLEITNEVATDVAQSIHSRPTLAQFELKREGGWLGEIGGQKLADVMTAITPQATDPFLSLRKRLEVTLQLYRFESTGARLVDWAVAQSGFDDPLSRFNRQELEQFHTRWRFELDAHLGRLLTECRREPEVLSEALVKAPPMAQRAVQKIRSMR
ncbi:MAG: DUF3553 domain-containing protein [Planctomycetes bacterium]|nr:DUF3553 domain-containing protein [Planctomycetota bacterium]